MTEDLDELREKIGDMHSGMLKAMLKLNELPLPLLKRYFAYKLLLDKIDGRMTPFDLLRIAMDVGLNPETGLFEKPITPMDMSMYDKASQDRVMAAKDGECVKVDFADTADTVVDLTEELEDEPFDEGPLNARPKEDPEPEDDLPDPANPDYGDEDDPEPAAAEETDLGEPGEPLYEVGAEVRVIDAGDILDGKVVSVDGDTYKIEIDGETREFFEEDIDA